jgi:predicted RNA-binding Zn-ribbon protein involved in translation (DUF1610 family)
VNPLKTKKNFQKNKEDFVCEHCGIEVKGNGYTNHCPNCLWSKHVDIIPGDRQALLTCGAMMKPIEIEGSTGKDYSVVHQCIKCGHKKKNKLAKTDNEDAVFKIIKDKTDRLAAKKI